MSLMTNDSLVNDDARGSISDWLCDEAERQMMGRTEEWQSLSSYRFKENSLTHDLHNTPPPPKKNVADSTREIQ
jgi:hypothetical protein